MSTSPSIPKGYGPAAHPRSSDDHSGWVVIASGVGLVFMLTFAGMRQWARNPFRTTLFPEDVALFVATVLAVVQSILVIQSANKGLGKSRRLLDHASNEQCHILIYASEAIFLAALFASKVSVLYLELRISPEQRHVKLTESGLMPCAAALLVRLVMVLYGCGARPWTEASSPCSSLYHRLIAVFCLDAAFEVYMFAVIMRTLAALQRKTRNKITATVMFALRLPVIAFADLRLAALGRLSHSSDPLFDRVIAVVWTQTALAYSLAAATTPTLIPFLSKLNTGIGALTLSDLIRQTTEQQSSRQHKGSYSLRSIQGKTASASQPNTLIRGDILGYKSSVVSPQADQRSIGSDDSTRVIIRNTVDVSYSPSPYDTFQGADR